MKFTLSWSMLITDAVSNFIPIFPTEIYECKYLISSWLVGPNSRDDPQ